MPFRHARNLFAVCLSVRGFVSAPVRETFALNPLKSNCRTFPISDLAGVPFEIPFCKVARQMGCADRMVRAENRALHETETAFGCVGMHEASQFGELICRVVHGAMVCEFFAYFFVG